MQLEQIQVQGGRGGLDPVPHRRAQQRHVPHRRRRGSLLPRHRLRRRPVGPLHHQIQARRRAAGPLAAPSNGASGGSEVASAAPAVGGRLIGGSTYVGSRVSVIIPLQTSQRQQGARGGAEPKPVPTRDRTTMSRPQWSGRAGMRKKTSG